MEYQQQQEATYDPSLYDQSGAYYAYANQHPYPYYDPYTQTYHHVYRDHAPIHPPGLPYQRDQIHPQDHRDVYHQQPRAVEAQQQQHLNSGSGSDSAAVVVQVTEATQLTHLVGNSEATQMAVHPPQTQSAYRGGRRGGRIFRGRGRGYHGPAAASPGRGRGRRHNSQGAESSSLNSILVPTDSQAVLMPPPASVTGHEQVLSNGQSAPPRQPPRMAWCELCRVECNTPEILEQHKNGKRHKKNLRLHEELQKLNKVKTGVQEVQMPKSESEAIQVQQFEESEGKGTKEGTVFPSADNDEKSKESQPLADTSDDLKAGIPNSAEPKGKSKDPSGSQRNSRGGRSTKYMRTNEGRRRTIEHPKPKEIIPLICGLCNVKCESQVVFNTHLVGKKHIANLKRFQGHRELYGEAGVQELYPSSLSAPSSSFVPPVQQGVADPQVVLAHLLNYVISQAQAQAQGQGQVQEQILPSLLAPLVAGVTASLAPAQASLLGIGTQNLHNPEAGSKDVIPSEPVCAKQYVAQKFEALSQGRIDNNNNNGNSESVASKNAMADGQALSATGTGLESISPDKQAVSLGQVVEPGSKTSIEEEPAGPTHKPDGKPDKEHERLCQ